jgi:hypothetical protein
VLSLLLLHQGEFPLDLVPVDDDVLSLELDGAFRYKHTPSLIAPSCPYACVGWCRDLICRGLVQATTTAVPCCWLGGWG